MAVAKVQLATQVSNLSTQAVSRFHTFKFNIYFNWQAGQEYVLHTH